MFANFDFDPAVTLRTCGPLNRRASMMHTMAEKFPLWQARQHRLAAELRDEQQFWRFTVLAPTA